MNRVSRRKNQKIIARLYLLYRPCMFAGTRDSERYQKGVERHEGLAGVGPRAQPAPEAVRPARGAVC